VVQVSRWHEADAAGSRGARRARSIAADRSFVCSARGTAQDQGRRGTYSAAGATYEEDETLRRLAVISLLGAVAIVAPAQASKPESPGARGGQNRQDKPKSKPDKPARPAKGGRCTPRSVGFNASGTLVSATLTAGEPRRFDGTLVVTVTRANHGAPKGEQTYTLANTRVRFGAGVDATAPAAGSRVRIHGTITRLNKRCEVGTFTPTVTVRKVDIAMAKPAPSPEPEPPEAPEAPKS
jgi:hypothetical protein